MSKMETTTLTCEPRPKTGTKAANQLRAGGKLPVIVYGHGEKPENFALDHHDVVVALARGVRMVKMEVGGKLQAFLIKEVQYDHLDHQPIHLDLTRVNLDERVTVRVGIELRGTPKGAHEGGILDQLMPDIEVECLVTAIPDVLRPVVTELDVGDALCVKDLTLPDGVRPLADGEERIAIVKQLATAAHEDEDEEGEGGEEVQPEVIGRAKKDEDSKDGESS